MAPPPPPNAPSDPLTASSYFHPTASSSESGAYAPLRAHIVQRATEMGYDVPTMTEHGVVWMDDQDPFGHVAGSTYARLVFKANFRVFESFARALGPEKWEELLKATGVGMLMRSYNIELRRQVVYPDCLLIATRIVEVKADRYLGITTIWSYKQQAVVAESSGYAVFYDYRKGKVVDLVAYGGEYAELHKDLTERSRLGNERRKIWDEKQAKGKKQKAKL